MYYKRVTYSYLSTDLIFITYCLQNVDKVKEEDLRSRGLCLVPISSTFPVATETSTDFWTPNFGGAFRQRYQEKGKVSMSTQRKTANDGPYLQPE